MARRLPFPPGSPTLGREEPMELSPIRLPIP